MSRTASVCASVTTRAIGSDQLGALDQHGLDHYLRKAVGALGADDVLSSLDDFIEQLEKIPDVDGNGNPTVINESVFAQNSLFEGAEETTHRAIVYTDLCASVCDSSRHPAMRAQTGLEDRTQLVMTYLTGNDKGKQTVSDTALMAGLVIDQVETIGDGRKKITYSEVVSGDKVEFVGSGKDINKLVIKESEERRKTDGIVHTNVEVAPPVMAVPTETSKTGASVAIDEDKLQRSRLFRQRRGKKEAYKAHVTPGMQRRTGTFWKFKPQFDSLLRQTAQKDPCVVLLGSGRTAGSGMVCAARHTFPNARIVCIDPELDPNSFPPDIQAIKTAYDGGKGPNDVLCDADIIVSDIAVADSGTFDDGYTTRAAVEIMRFIGQEEKKTGKRPLFVYKDHLKHISTRRSSVLYFGRGHNHEMFVHVYNANGKYMHPHAIKEIIMEKEKCDAARNSAILGKCQITQKTTRSIYIPNPVTGMLHPAQPWSKCRDRALLTNHHLTNSEVLDMVTTGHELSPENSQLLQMIRAIALLAPGHDTLSSAHSSNAILRHMQGLSITSHRLSRPKKGKRKKNTSKDLERLSVLH